jgi:hypothetical protein
MKIIQGIALAGVILVMASPANAGNFTCGQQLIRESERVGPFKEEVERKCGAPTFTQGNVWVYERGQRFTTILTFNARGQLTSISRR